MFPGECGSRPREASGVPRSQSEASRAALSPQGRRGRAQCWPGTRRVSVPTPPTVRLGVGDRVTGVHEHQLAPQWSTGGLQWRGEGRPVGAWPGEGRHRASRGAQAHGKGLVQGSVDTEGGPMEGSHVSEGGGRGSEQRPRLPHTLPLVSLPRLAPALPPAPPHLFCSPPAVHSLRELWLWAASSPPSRARVLPPVSAAWLLEPRPPGEEGGRWHRAERSRKGPRPPLRAAGGPVQLVSNASTPGLRATGGRPRT